MLTMDQKQQILHHYRVDEDGLREISRKVGVDRKTVRRLDGMADEPKIPKNFRSKILWVCEEKDAYDLSHKWMRKYGRESYLPSV